MREPSVKRLSSGWTHIRWNQNCWAQIPPGFGDDTIPDEHIFAPEWSRERVNAWWRLAAREVLG